MGDPPIGSGPHHPSSPKQQRLCEYFKLVILVQMVNYLAGQGVMTTWNHNFNTNLWHHQHPLAFHKSLSSNQYGD